MTITLTIFFLFSNIISADMLSFPSFMNVAATNTNLSLITSSITGTEVVYAAPRGSSSGFRSGSFKSTSKASTSSGFKSGSFTSTPKSAPKSSTGSSSSNYSSSKTFIPIPIPIFGNSGYYGGSGIGIVGGFFSGFLKFILFLVIVIVIIRIFRKRRY